MRFFAQLLVVSALLSAGVPLSALAQSGSPPVGGEVMFISGQAERIKSDGAGQAVSKGMQLLEGDRIRTRADSHVYVRMRDGGLLVVRPSSELHVDLWRFDAGQPQASKIKYTLDSGVARHVSGQGAKAARDGFRFNTPMAAIGVRGTDFTVLAEPAVTRVSVQSGGVIVNSLGNGCRADGLGPCEGASAVELFASAKDKLVQLRLGERRPELVDETSVSPDKARPASIGEPVAQPKASADLNLAESRSSVLVATAQVEKPTPPIEPPIAVWGRWAAIADKDPGVVDAAEVLAGRSLVGINSHYLLGNVPITVERCRVTAPLT